MVRRCSLTMHFKPTVLPLPCRLIGDWRPNEVTPELAKKVLGLKCANLDGPTVLFVTPLFWYVWHVEKVLKQLFCQAPRVFILSWSDLKY
jgi:hypothetical protein